MKRFLFAAAAALLLSINSQAQPVTQPSVELAPIADKILRMPALNPDGRTLAFVYDGDIWSVPSNGGDARRLTITADNEGDPKFSPDGKWLAFRSRRYGSDSLFIMPAQGGTATRLTYADTTDAPCCWLPDSSGLIFASSRRDGGADLWVIRTEGGEPWPITGGGFRSNELAAAISPNGKHIVYMTRGGDPMRRRGYEGASSGELWLCDFDGVLTRNHRRLTNNRSHDAWPVFADNETILYVTNAASARSSDRVGRLTACNLKGEIISGWGGETRLDPRELAVGGGRLAFATGNYSGWRLHVGELGRRPPTKVSSPEIRINTDSRFGDFRTSRVSSVSEFNVSPDGKKLAFVAGGDVFVMPTEDGGVPRQETDTVWREKDIQWAPDSIHIMFARIEASGIQLYQRNLITREETAVAPGRAGTSRAKYIAPGRILAIENDSAIVSLSGSPEVRIEGYFSRANIGTGDLFDVSPDGKWILYTQPNDIYNWQVWVANLETGERQAITKLYGHCFGASFSTDGKRVVFSNNQEDENHDLWVIDLQKRPLEFREDKLEKLLKEPAKKEPPKEEAEKKEGEEPKPAPARTPAPRKPAETKIDFTDLERRTRRITTDSGNESNGISTDDGKSFYFIGSAQGQSNIWKLTLDPDKGPDLKQLTQSRSAKSALRLSADEKSLWFLDGGNMTSMLIANSRLTAYPISVEIKRDRRELRDATFEEAVWVMGEYFYDPKHHGINWRETASRYRQALDATSTGDEFGAVFNELLGELNSSHQGFGATDERSDGGSETTGWLGLRFDPAGLSRGEYQIVEVLKDGPCDIDSPPEAGKYLAGINGKALSRGSNLARELTGAIGRKTVLHISDTPSLEGAREVAVKPASRGQESRLHYQRWVDWQRKIVHEKSGGRLGYVHIQAMNQGSVKHFIHHLGNDMLGKEGVVLDVRFNGGGSTAVDLLEILIKRPWLIRQNRGLHNVSENAYRSITLEKPSILLINQDSFSNAEIMAEGFRRLKIGSIVGVETAGGVIGTGSFTLIDGSSMRLPGTGAYTVDGENLENNGRKPDINVDTHIEELDKGIDVQTEQAVKTLLEQIKKG